MSDILEEAASIIRGNRHGEPERNLGSIADLWTAYLGAAGLLREDRLLASHDVAMLMVLLKAARVATRPTRDSFVDIAGYSALAAEVGGFE